MGTVPPEESSPLALEPKGRRELLVEAELFPYFPPQKAEARSKWA